MGMIRWLGFAAGIVLLLATASSAIKTLLIPRAARTVLGSSLAWLVRGAFRKVTARVEDLRQRERILAATGPVWLISLLVCWLVCLLFGYALLLWPLNHHTFALSLEESGSSLFTLGFVRPFGTGPTAGSRPAAWPWWHCSSLTCRCSTLRSTAGRSRSPRWRRWPAPRRGARNCWPAKR